MLLSEAMELLEAGESICREAWTLTDGYLHLLKGMSHVWKVLLPPASNAGNYIFSKEDIKADDWKKFELTKQDTEETLIDI